MTTRSADPIWLPVRAYTHARAAAEDRRVLEAHGIPARLGSGGGSWLGTPPLPGPWALELFVPSDRHAEARRLIPLDLDPG